MADHDSLASGIVCRCLMDCPDNQINSTCILKSTAKCYKKGFLNEDGELEIHAGCLGTEHRFLDQCNKRAHPNFEEPTVIKCCNNESLCNDHLEILSVETDDVIEESMDITIVIIIIGVIFFVLFLLVIAVYIARMCRREAKRRRQVEAENKHAGCPVLHGGPGHCATNGNHRAMGDMMEDWSSLVDSGSGMPLLVQRTVSRQIESVREIGRGRYGRVMLGKWREENVALKIFHSTDEDSWRRETEIYQTVPLRHENVLGFIAADISGTGSWTQLIIITEYHERGSLYDYLQHKVIDVSEALRLAHSSCAGLAHLHVEIAGTRGKPAIAHRDIKTKNILVKRDGQCCIADMGLAVRYSRSDGRIDIGNCERTRQGTVRYMAPEVLSQTFYTDSFEAFKASDVYGFSLVMWEIINRTLVSGAASKEHLLPYHDVVESDPDFDEMCQVVAVDNIRPEVHDEWAKHRIMSTYVSTMRECWAARPESRLAMLRVRKTLYNLLDGLHRPGAFDSGASDSSGSERKPSASSSTEPLTGGASDAPPPGSTNRVVLDFM